MKIFTAIQPTGDMTIGNYIGAIKNLENYMNNTQEVYLAVADLHSLTINPEPKELKENTKKLLSLFYALGLNEKCQIMVQSKIPAHTQLCWVLMNYVRMGELERMTQYKDKIQKKTNIPNVGLFSYPVLMAADILLYDATHVPVGIDQKQHLELAREIAERFNSQVKEDSFVIPKPLIDEQSAKIYSLTDPLKKMSKSDENPKSFISLFDDEKTIIKKIKSAITDSFGEINYDIEKQPGVSNLLIIYKEMKNISLEETIEYFKGKQYGFLKKEVAQAIIDVLIPIQEKYNYFYENFSKINEELENNHLKINEKTNEKVKKIYNIIGLR